MKMLKFIFIGGILSVSSLFANSNFYSGYLDMLNNDIKTVNSIAIGNLTDMNENKLSLLNMKIISIDEQLNTINSQLNGQKLDTTTINKIIDDVNNLSNQVVQLAGILAYLSNHQADNANQSYNDTFKTLVSATLRLSDDIGKMADRILLMAKEIGYMADRIGIMADRILETQRIQSVNYNNTINLLNNLK